MAKKVTKKKPSNLHDETRRPRRRKPVLKPHNPQDATLRNTQATHRRFRHLGDALRELRARVDALEEVVAGRKP